MSIKDNIVEIKPMKIDINDIFDKKIELSPLLEFTLLQRIIEELLNRQKETNDRITEIENKINFNQNIIQPIASSNLYNINEINSMTEFPNEINEEENVNKEEKDIKDNNENENKNDNKDKETNKDINKDIDKGSDKIVEKSTTLLQTNKNESKRANAIIQQILNKVNMLENKFNELFDNFDLFKKENKKEAQTMKNKNKEFNKKICELENMINDIQINKNDDENNVVAIANDDDNEPGNADTDKVKIWIKNLEQKITKKIEFSDKRSKNNENSFNELKDEVSDIKNKLDNFELMISNLKKDDGNKIEDDLEDKNGKLDNFVTKEEFENLKNELNQKFEDSNKNILENLLKNSNENKFDDSIIHKLGNMYQNLKENVSKSIENNEKYVKNQIKKLDIDSIKKEIEKIRNELNSKLTKDNLNSINLKFEDLENAGENIRTIADDNKKDIRVCNDKYSKLFKYIETIRGQVLTLLEKDETENKKNKEDYNLDLSALLTREEFLDNKEKVNKRMDKILSQESDNYRMIQEIFKKLNNFVTETELQNLEQYLLNLLNETKIKIAKNFVERAELQKSIKFLDIRIKQLEETASKENENWLLAKKPMNGFLCASCEAYIGDLKTNEEVATWNKLTDRKNRRNYRIGHGFSTMLKLINSDLLKRAEKENNNHSSINNNTIKQEENKKINHKLPKIKILQNTNQNINEIQNGNMNNSNNTEENNENLNNSSNNIKTQIQFDRNSNINMKGQLSERAINKRHVINYFNKDLTEEEAEPKVVKISKMYKKI